MQHPQSFQDIDFTPILQMRSCLIGLKLCIMCMTRICHMHLVTMKKIISISGPEQ